MAVEDNPNYKKWRGALDTYTIAEILYQETKMAKASAREIAVAKKVRDDARKLYDMITDVL